MGISFNPTTRRIILDAAQVTATEIYSRWCDWAAEGDHVKFGQVVKQVGGDDLGQGLSIPPYFFLQNGWRLQPMEADHDLTLTGNLFTAEGDSPVVRTLGAFQVNVTRVVPVQAQGINTGGTTVAPLTEQDKRDIAARVWGTPVAQAQSSGTIGEFITKKLLTLKQFLALS